MKKILLAVRKLSLLSSLYYCTGFRPLVAAQAWIPPSLVLASTTTANRIHHSNNHHHQYHYQHLHLCRTTTSLTAVNGDNDKARRTGWNHSTPGAASKFWKATPETKAENNNNDNRKRPLKTGWLHNTQSRQALEEEEQKKQKQKQSNNNDNDKTQRTTPARRLLELAMKQRERQHRLLHPVTFHATDGDSGVVAVSEHLISVPLRHDDKSSDAEERIDVFFTICERVTTAAHRAWLQNLAHLDPLQRAAAYVQHAAMDTADGLLLYLQGGPGFGAPTPVVSLGLSSPASSWAAQALHGGTSYQRLVLMDQRGTGQSTTLTKQSLERKFPDLFLLDHDDDNNDNAPADLSSYRESNPVAYARVKQAVSDAVDYLTQFRADHIVQDAELIRDALLLPTETEELARPWGACLGQSFGGFCILTYLSQVAHPPQICLLTGGIGPALFAARDVYTSLWRRVQERSLLYYDMYPDDVSLVRKIVRRLVDQPQPLPSGGTLTAQRFLQLGIALGGSPLSFASLHSLFQSAFLQGTENDKVPEFNRAFLKRIELEQSYDDHPIYFWLHESIYADGPEFAPTAWAAHQAYESIVAQDASFDYRKTCAPDSEQPVIFFGEMTFPWMTQDYGELKGVGLSEMAQMIAQKNDWPNLYNADHMKKVLSSGKTRAAAAVYVDDMYVDFDCCRKLTARGGPLEKCKVWITNDYQHSGLRDDGADIFKKLHGMASGSIRTPS